MMKLTLTIVGLVIFTSYLGQAAEKKSNADTRRLPEYTAAEAKKHVGETVRVTDKVGCALANRHGGLQRRSRRLRCTYAILGRHTYHPELAATIYETSTNNT